MITIPCKCGAAVVLPPDESSPMCPKCKGSVQVRWFKPRGVFGTPSYFSASDIRCNYMISSGRVRANGEAGAKQT